MIIEFRVDNVIIVIGLKKYICLLVLFIYFYYNVCFDGFMFFGCSFYSSNVIVKVVLWYKALVFI